jgi:hypothetical protein
MALMSEHDGEQKQPQRACFCRLTERFCPETGRFWLETGEI